MKRFSNFQTLQVTLAASVGSLKLCQKAENRCNVMNITNFMLQLLFYSAVFSDCCCPCSQTLSRSRTTAWRLLRGRAPPTVRTPSADTGTDEGLPKPTPTPSLKPNKMSRTGILSRLCTPLPLLILANHVFIYLFNFAVL